MDTGKWISKVRSTFLTTREDVDRPATLFLCSIQKLSRSCPRYVMLLQAPALLGRKVCSAAGFLSSILEALKLLLPMMIFPPQLSLWWYYFRDGSVLTTLAVREGLGIDIFCLDSCYLDTDINYSSYIPRNFCGHKTHVQENLCSSNLLGHYSRKVNPF
jgi:hypothetical protein